MIKQGNILGKNNYRPWAPIALLLGIAVFFRLLNINRSFSGDEAILINISAKDLGRIIPSLLQTEVYPPLTYILVHYFMKITTAVFFIRFYFVIFGIGCCLFVYLLAKEFMGRIGALIALAMAAASPLLIFASQYSRSYIDSAFWMLASALFMLKIIKGNDHLMNQIGYILSSSAAIYTFYFSILLLCAQAIFIAIFNWNKRKALAKWAFAFLAIGLIFLPWAERAISQFRNVSGVMYDWAGKGVNVGGLRLGMYARNLATLLGFDPYFMVYGEGIHKHYAKTALVTIALCFIALFVLFIRYYIRLTACDYPDRRDISWFMPFLSLCPVFLSWVMAGALNTLPNGRYLVGSHALFLVMAAVGIYNLLRERPIAGKIALACVAIIFILRLPQAVSPEFDAAAASAFVKKNVAAGEPLVCVGSLPEGADKLYVIRTDKYLKMDSRRSRYMAASEDAGTALAEELSLYKRIWFYRVYGNVEIFGANSIVEAWLLESGFRRARINKFKNIDVIAYEK